MRTAFLAVLTALLLVSDIAGVSRVSSQDVAPESAIAGAMLAGAYARAEKLAADWVDRLDADQATDGRALAGALDALIAAQVRNGKAGLSSTLADAERAVRLAEGALGIRHLETASAVHILGIVQAQRGDFAAALRSQQRVLAIRTSALAAGDPALADALDQAASALVQLERFAEAKARLDQSLPIRETHAAAAPLALASTLDLLGMYHRYAGTFALAVPPLDRSLALRAQTAPDHPDRIMTLQWRADVTFLMGDVRGAESMWASALGLAQRTLGGDHPAVAELLRRLGLAAFSLGNLADARALRERALEIGERRLARCDPSSVTLMNAVAISRQLDGEYSAARGLFERARTRTESCAGSNAALATILYNEAELGEVIGNLAEAERLYQQAVTIWSKNLGGNHPFVARGLSALAEVSTRRGRPLNARSLYERALAIQRRSLGADHPQVAWTLTNLARTVATSDAALAFRYLEQAAAIYRKSGAPDEPDHLARLLELRSTLELRRGALEPARRDLLEALSTRERMLGATHPLTAETRAALARVDLVRGARSEAMEAALASDAASRDHLRTTVRYLPEREAMAYASRRPGGLDTALSLVAVDPDAGPRVLDAVIRSRGVVLEELAERSRTAYADTTQFLSPAARVAAARQRLATLVVRSFSEPVPLALLDEARRQEDAAERDLAERSADARAEMARAAVGVSDIGRALPPQSVLVSFVRYDHAEAATPGPTPSVPRSRPAYAAFVTNSGTGATRFVALGAAAGIDVLIKAWHDEAAGRSLARGIAVPEAERLYAAAAMRLRRAVWDPVASHFAAATRVFVVPDGQLSVVNFAALPDRRGYLADTSTLIHYLTTERDLTMPAREAGGSSRLLAVGGPAFDSPRPATQAAAARVRAGCSSLGLTRFEALPGSLIEVAEISKLWPAGSADAVTVLTGHSATEAAVKQAVAGRRVVHLATHGFFVGVECGPGVAGTRAVGGLAFAPRQDTRPTDENPLSLAGLVLAGANRRQPASSDLDEGILTAEEIAGLNLQGLEWAVLSACDTGLGEIRAGEGVIGLRRAFQVAGARTVIMSLWEVDDRSAQGWMKALYRGRFQRGLSTAESVHAATIEVLSARRAQRVSTHPFFWAPFVAAGDWR